MAAENGSHHPNYFLIFLALCGLTGLSVVFDLVEFEDRIFLVVAVLAVATAKALFVMTYFMHLKFEGRWKFVLLAPTIILAMGLPMALLPDIGVHYYLQIVPQGEAVVTHGDHDDHGSSTPEASDESHDAPAHGDH